MLTIANKQQNLKVDQGSLRDSQSTIGKARSNKMDSDVVVVDQPSTKIIRINDSSQKSVVSLRSTSKKQCCSKNSQRLSTELQVLDWKQPHAALNEIGTGTMKRSEVGNLSARIKDCAVDLTGSSSPETRPKLQTLRSDGSQRQSSKVNNCEAKRRLSDNYSSSLLEQHAQINNINSRYQQNKNKNSLRQSSKQQANKMPTLRKRGCAVPTRTQKSLARDSVVAKPPAKRQKRNNTGGYMNSNVSKQEQRLIYQALKNSLVESENINSKLDEIEQMPVFRPTEEEFKSPIDYIEKLYYEQKVSQYGCIKIIPPASFKPELSFDIESDRRLPTRFQVLQKLAQGQPFHQNREGHTFKDFQKIAKIREREDEDINWDNDQEVYNRIERKYWEIVDNQVGDEIKVEYAADLDAGKFGSGFGRKDHRLNKDGKKNEFEDHPWNLNNFQTQMNSMLQFKTLKKMSGVNIPWVYVGMKYSTFCWHYEDLMLPSINYSHYGKPKLWYGVPECHREKFDRVVKEKCSLLFKKDPNILYDVTTMVSPAYLQTHGVKMFKTLQRPGEFVVTYPGSYHSGFSTGLNIGEAVNFATKTWFQYGFKCQQIYRASRERIPVFPIEWLVLENIRNINSIDLNISEIKVLKDNFSFLVNEELRLRQKMEEKLRKGLQEGTDGLSVAQQIANKTQLLHNRDQIDEDQFQCKLCTDLCYFSMIKCKVHTCLPDQDQNEMPKQRDEEQKEQGPAVEEKSELVQRRYSSRQMAMQSQEACSSQQTTNSKGSPRCQKKSTQNKSKPQNSSQQQSPRASPRSCQQEQQKDQKSAQCASKYEMRRQRVNQIEVQEQYCIQHLDFCKCPMDNYEIIYRFSSQELIDARDRIDRIYQERAFKYKIENYKSMKPTTNSAVLKHSPKN